MKLKVQDKGNILIWIAIILLIILSLFNLTRNPPGAYAGLAVAIGMVLYWFLKGRKMI